jgi:hypothetical protein
VLSGRLASEDSRQRLLKIFQEFGNAVRITDRIDIDQTLVPGTWEREKEDLLPELLSAFQGEMTAEFLADQIRLRGTTETEESYEMLLNRLKQLKTDTATPEILAEVTVAEEQVPTTSETIKAPELLITFQPQLLILTGLLPDLSFLESLEANLESWNKSYEVKNELAENPNSADAEWVGSLGEFLEEAAMRVESGVFRFSKEGLKMEGMTRELSDKQILQNVAVNSVPSNFPIENLLAHEEEAFPEPELLPRIGRNSPNRSRSIRFTFRRTVT